MPAPEEHDFEIGIDWCEIRKDLILRELLRQALFYEKNGNVMPFSLKKTERIMTRVREKIREDLRRKTERN